MTTIAWRAASPFASATARTSVLAAGRTSWPTDPPPTPLRVCPSLRLVPSSARPPRPCTRNAHACLHACACSLSFGQRSHCVPAWGPPQQECMCMHANRMLVNGGNWCIRYVEGLQKLGVLWKQGAPPAPLMRSPPGSGPSTWQHGSGNRGRQLSDMGSELFTSMGTDL